MPLSVKSFGTALEDTNEFIDATPQKQDGNALGCKRY